MVIFTSFTVLTMVLRFCAARVQRRALRADDYLIVGAFVSLEPSKDETPKKRQKLMTYTLVGLSSSLGRHYLLG
jgi:hypothetical protein